MLASLSNHAEIQDHARRFLSDLGVREPPLDADSCLAHRHLQVDNCPLDELLELRDDGVQPPPARSKIHAVLDVRGRRMWLKDKLHPHQRKFGKLHETGHDVLPWQSQYLYFCTILDLPEAIRGEWEREANAFAVECLFLSGRFMAQALDMPFGIRTAKQLADEFDASFEAAFRHYVEQAGRPCMLLVTEPAKPAGGLVMTGDVAEFKLLYYVVSPTCPVRLRRGLLFRSAALSRFFTVARPTEDGRGITLSIPPEVVDHEMTNAKDGSVWHCQSFFNSYKVFTLASLEPFRD